MSIDEEDPWDRAVIVCKRCAARRNLVLSLDLVQRVEGVCDICGVYKTVFDLEDFELGERHE